ncbi:SDR family NAD(P)-dependent oxidoreductase [Sinisalibacter aestuarii]|uniref:Dehydrogenase n=1 Tax=Sinisalibacter aestuarii TaxID=2949426 RepID=A0ABQ5LS58_9RHOB|nr:glucose 1-dehydrogenase [Sinisalibacter aestuarii]GKY87086.1 dehydrogenase [Sinisalibacter aestuarii]
MNGIEGAVAVVTGAAQGNGKAIAAGLAKHGAHVALCDIQLDRVEEAAAELRADGYKVEAFEVNVTDADSVSRLAANVASKLGRTEILVNNAGIIRRTPVASETFDADWSAVMAVNGTGPMLLVRAFLDDLRATKGRIINVGSIMSVTAGPGLVAYAASKGAVLQMTKALAHDLSEYGIRVNAIAPGVIETPMTEVTRNDPDAIGRFMAHTPLKRPGKPDELIGPVLFLGSHLSSYVTGILLPVDGGYLAA